MSRWPSAFSSQQTDKAKESAVIKQPSALAKSGMSTDDPCSTKNHSSSTQGHTNAYTQRDNNCSANATRLALPLLKAAESRLPSKWGTYLKPHGASSKQKEGICPRPQE